MKRKKIVAGNWKMNKTVPESIELAVEIKNKLNEISDVDCEVILAPTSLALYSVLESTKGTRIKCAAQNMHFETNGAFTGEISPAMLKNCNTEYSIIGHSERRSIFEESDQLLSKKVSAAIAHSIQPIFCVGENLTEREKNNHEATVRSQIEKGVFHLSESDIKKTVIAYEPVWAIGTGVTASKEQANDMHLFIRGLISNKYSKEIAENISILYGGSVKPSNAKELFAQEHIDGGLIGGAALDADNFINIIKSI